MLPNGHIALRSANELAALPHLPLISWCRDNARYTIVTRELVQWLREVIAGRSAIEVGAGHGDLGYHLEIPMTDSAIQTNPVIAQIIRSRGNLPITPPPDVERIDAEAAQRKYKPRVIIASWLTQKTEQEDVDGGSMFGANERALVASVETYVHIGNLRSHHLKYILALPHQEFRFPWLWSRSRFPRDNRIWVWNQGRGQ